MKKINVLLTDGNYQNTNAIARSLRNKKLNVAVICNSIFDINYVSNIPNEKFIFRTNILKRNDEEAFEKYWGELERILSIFNVEVFMPVGNISFNFASKYKKKIEKYCKVPVVEIDKMIIAQNKNLTFKFAEKIGIPVPKTFWISNREEVKQIIDSITFPCVLKNTNYNEGGVTYCNTKDELLKSLSNIFNSKKDKNNYPIVQEFISGYGTGYYSVFKEGECLGYFMHERIHEFPITGGASTLARSVYKEDLKILGDKILKELKWSGVSMIEFKRDIFDNSLKLMEINPKFWGSYELSYVAGINFAYLNYLTAIGEEVPQTSYKQEVYFRWVIPGDFLWYMFSNRRERKKFKELKRKVRFKTNLHLDDPLVILHHLVHLIFKIFKSKKYPHGIIKQKN